METGQPGTEPGQDNETPGSDESYLMVEWHISALSPAAVRRMRRLTWSTAIAGVLTIAAVIDLRTIRHAALAAGATQAHQSVHQILVTGAISFLVLTTAAVFTVWTVAAIARSRSIPARMAGWFRRPASPTAADAA